MDLFPLVLVACLLMAAVALYRRAPKCPRCGSIFVSRDHDQSRPGRIRQCADCHEVYEVRDA